MKKLFPLLFVLLFTACLPDQDLASSEIKIIEGEIGGKKYFVPEGYFKFKGMPFAEDNIYLHTMYPDFLPLTKKPMEYWEKNGWWMNVNILAQHYPNSKLTTEDLALNQIEYLKAFEVVGKQYDLIHQTQPKEYIQDHKDVWLEVNNGQIRSIIMCSESLIKNDFPQCTQHYYLQPKFHVKVDFDKRMLKDWKEIDAGVRRLFSSFQSSAKAKGFLKRQISLAQSQDEEKKRAKH